MIYIKEGFEERQSSLFPISNTGKTRDEDTTSSIFIACLIAIKEFREAFLSEISISTGIFSQLHSYSQIQLDEIDSRPDGFLILTKQKKLTVNWSAFVEFKTKGKLEKEQIDRYIKEANRLGINAVITISNDFVTPPSQNIIYPNKNAIKKVNLHHFSWARIMTILSNIIQSGIDDSDQVYLAVQLLEYLDKHPDIGNYHQMSKFWKDSITIIRSNKETTTNTNEARQNIASDWLQEEQDICLQLRRKYHKKINLKLSKDELKNLSKRVAAVIKNFNEKPINTLESIYQVKLKLDNPQSKKKNSDQTESVLPRFNRYYGTDSLCIYNQLDVTTGIHEVSFSLDRFERKTLKTQFKDLVKLFKENNVDGNIILQAFYPHKREYIASESLSVFYKDLERGDILKHVPNESSQPVKRFQIIQQINISSACNYRKKVVERMEESIFAFFTTTINPFAEDL